MARLVAVVVLCHHEAAAVHQASVVAMTSLAKRTLVLERTLRQVVCRITMGTPPTASEVRSTSGPQAGGTGLLLLTDSVRRESRHTRGEWSISCETLGRGTPICTACMVSPWRRPLGTRWGPTVMSACVMTATTRRQAVVRDQDHNG
jgi:hypothetical protein